MKKKYLAMLLSVIMCSSVFFTGCGKTAEEPAAEEDEEDEEDDDDDKDDDDDDDDDEDKDDDKNVYVETIDDDMLADQIKVFVKNKKLWSVTDDSTIVLADSGYCVADLDHNGRCEIIVLTESAYSTVTDMRIYEITEKGDAFREAEFDYTGIKDECSSLVPDLIYFPLSETYYDEKKQVTHYLINNRYDNGNGEYGNCFCDLSYSEGKARVYTYASVRVNESFSLDTQQFDYEYTYTSPDGEMSEKEYYDTIDGYPEAHGCSDMEFGIYYRGWSDDYGVMKLEDSLLVSVLTDSYKVFAGKMEYADFYQSYNDPWAPGSDTETYYEQYIGNWGLYYSEVDGYEEYYTSSSFHYMTIEFTSDFEAVMTNYENGEVTNVWRAEINMDDDMRPYFDMDDTSRLPDGYVCDRYTVLGMNSDRDLITVDVTFYGEDGCLGGSTLKLIKD